MIPVPPVSTLFPYTTLFRSCVTPSADGLLERAIGYTLGSLLLVTPAAMTRPTPCADWDLGALLRHMDDSLAALHERSEEHTSELQSRRDLVCRLLLEKKKED